VLSDIARRRVDEIVCLGDVAAGGPQPRETLERPRTLGCAVVSGNADEWLLGCCRQREDEACPGSCVRPSAKGQQDEYERDVDGEEDCRRKKEPPTSTPTLRAI
jgi:hypothetical protein